MFSTDPLLAIVEMLTELCRRHVHREPVTVKIGETSWQRIHQVKVPALLVQLDQATPLTGAGEHLGGGYTSQPAGNLEALDALARIDQAAARWVRDLGWDDPGDTIVCVQLLQGLAAGLDWCQRTRPQRQEGRVICCPRHMLEVDVRRWWTQARIVTGWDRAPWKPDNTCPCCGVRGVLLIRLEDRAAFCTRCHETWGPDSYQVLAEHIRIESAFERQAAAPGVCGPVSPPRFGLGVMCARCGSSQCVNAVRATKRRTTSGEWEAV